MPEGWAWTSIDDIAFVTKLAGFEYTEYIANNLTGHDGVPLFKGKNVQDGKIIYHFESFIPKEISDELPRSQVRRKCLLTPYVGTIGNIGIHDKEGFYHLGSNVGKIEILNGNQTDIYEEYVKLFLQSTSGYKELTKQKKATAQDSISIEAIREVLIPIPPRGEQQRILQEISHWLSFVESIEQAETSINDTICAAKARILELAIHGKLVPQDPSDEPAIELLKRINPDFKPSDNLHYDAKLPDGWCVARLEEVAEYGDTSNVDVTTITSSSWVLELEDIEKDTASVLEKKKKSDREINGVRHSFRKGQILYSKLRTYLNKVLIATEDGFCSTEIVPITASKALLSEYLLIVLRSPYFLEYTASCGYGVKMPRLGTNDAKKAIIPIPPHAEQVRIVKKVSDLMTVISSL